jgi:hypothetical protein
VCWLWHAFSARQKDQTQKGHDDYVQKVWSHIYSKKWQEVQAGIAKRGVKIKLKVQRPPEKADALASAGRAKGKMNKPQVFGFK